MLCKNVKKSKYRVKLNALKKEYEMRGEGEHKLKWNLMERVERPRIFFLTHVGRRYSSGEIPWIIILAFYNSSPRA